MDLKKASLLVGLAALVAAGCGSSDSTASAAEANAFKNHDKSAVKGPPADAMKPPANFSSSISGPGPGSPPAGGK